MSTTGKKTLRGFPSWILPASPGSKFYKRGYTIGAPASKSSSDRKTPAAPSSKRTLQETLLELEKERAKAIPHQFGKTDG